MRGLSVRGDARTRAEGPDGTVCSCHRRWRQWSLLPRRSLLSPPLQGGASTSYSLLPVKLTGSGGGPAVTRHLYIKQHASPADGLPKERALFVAGIPAALQGPPLVELFARYGEVERAALHGSRVSAVLLYRAAEGLAALLKAAAKRRPLELRLPEPQGPCGLKGGGVLTQMTPLS